MEKSPEKQTPSTQELLEVTGIEQDALVLKNGGLRKLLIVSGMNFELKSEEEQNTVVAGYQNFLNALDFPLQIFIHSRKINIGEYREGLRAHANAENELLKSLLAQYDGFIASLVSDNAIMQKRFFAVIPHDPFILPGAGKTIAEKITKAFKRSPAEPAEKSEDASAIPETEFATLNQRAEQAINGLSAIGLRALPLVKDELIELLYNLYNPETTERRGIPADKNNG